MQYSQKRINIFVHFQQVHKNTIISTLLFIDNKATKIENILLTQKEMREIYELANSIKRDVLKAHSFRCGMDSTNNVYVGIENIHIL